MLNFPIVFNGNDIGWLHFWISLFYDDYLFQSNEIKEMKS